MMNSIANLFTPKAPQSYDQQLAQAAYQQKMAEALQAQSDAPLDIQSYKGIQAPIPWTAVLAKALEGYGGNVMQKRALEGQARAEALAQSNMMDALNAGPPPPAPPGPGAINAMSAPNAPPENAGSQLASVLAMGGAAPSDAGPPPPAPIPPPVADNPMGPQAASQNAGLVQGNAPPPQAMPPASAPPVADNPMDPQAASQNADLVQALQGNAPPPQATPPASAPPMPQPPMPLPATAPLNVYSDPLSQAQAKLARLQIVATSPQIGPTQRAQLVPMIVDARKQIDTLTTEKLKAEAADNQQQANIASISKAIDTLTGVTPEVRATMRALTSSNPDGAKEYFTVIAQNTLKPHEHWATPAEMQASGIPPGSVAQINDQTGDAKILINGHTMMTEDQNVALRKQEVGISGAKLALSKAEFNRETLMPPTTIEHVVNGEPVQISAMFNKKTGGYVDMQGKPVDPTGLRVLPNGGSRALIGLSRTMTNAADAATGLENLSKLPSGSQGAWFSQAANTSLGALKRKLTPQEAQDIRTTGAGLSRAFGGLATGGMQVNKDVSSSYDALLPQAGQSRLTALRQMAEFRQQGENAIEVALSNPYITPAQTAVLLKAKTKLQNSVPWTPTDVSALETKNDSGATMRSMGQKTLSAAAPVTKTIDGVTYTKTPNGWEHK